MLDLDFKQLMRLTKKDLIGIISTISKDYDELFERAETLEKDKEELEDEMSDYQGKIDKFNVAMDIMQRIAESRWKLSLGVESEREELEKLTEKLEEILA